MVSFRTIIPGNGKPIGRMQLCSTPWVCPGKVRNEVTFEVGPATLGTGRGVSPSGRAALRLHDGPWHLCLCGPSFTKNMKNSILQPHCYKGRCINIIYSNIYSDLKVNFFYYKKLQRFPGPLKVLHLLRPVGWWVLPMRPVAVALGLMGHVSRSWLRCAV